MNTLSKTHILAHFFHIQIFHAHDIIGIGYLPRLLMQKNPFADVRYGYGSVPLSSFAFYNGSVLLFVSPYISSVDWEERQLPPLLFVQAVLSVFAQLGNPVFEVMNELPMDCIKLLAALISRFRLPIFVLIPRFSICRTAAPSWTVGTISSPCLGIGTQVHTLRAVIGFQIAVLDDFPFMPPDFTILLVVPVNGIFLMAFPPAG